ncbi:uncharacterized protein [Clytia hemisphaerica]|uniref:Uncharacterized protein n=1 Tax=Clytia hemisphaerica TaxID=252671 RepID=A0A7M5X4K4_9CNID
MGHHYQHHYEPLSKDHKYSTADDDVFHRPGVTYQRREQFKDILRPVLFIQYFFGQSYLSPSFFMVCLSKVMFLLLLGSIGLVFALGVFHRSFIDMWVQFSLYIIPLLCIPIGAYIFGSSAYSRMLSRNITNSVAVRFYVRNSFIDGDPHAPGHNRDWLKSVAIKSVIFPFLLEILQWSFFVVFFMRKKNSVVGEVIVFGDQSYLLWLLMYISNWCITVYIVGFIAYQFIFVSRLIVKDSVHLMSLFGKTSYLQIYPVASFAALRRNCCFNFFSALANFITLDLFNSFFDERVYTNCAEVKRGKNTSSRPQSILPTRQLHSPFGRDGNGNEDADDDDREQGIFCKLTPSEACELFSVFIAEAEALSSLFVPFNVVLAFFGVADLFTHVGLYIRRNESISYWTMFRTCLFLLIALRMMICVQRISSVLGKILPHINLIKTAGKLSKDNDERPNWNDFTDLLASYNLGQKSFGFPMTIRQIASFVTVINLAFLTVFSVMSNPKTSNINTMDGKYFLNASMIRNLTNI